MQFHLNGFRPGDPELSDPAPDNKGSNSGSLADEVDVLIVGCGPAGLTLAAHLSAFPDVNTRVVEQKSGPLRLGQADGIACRTMEMFEAFGFSERVLKEAHWVNETTFWKPDDRHRERIVRHGRIQDVEDGLSEFPHVVLNQARVHDNYLDVMRKSASKLEPHYGWRVAASAHKRCQTQRGGSGKELAPAGTSLLHTRCISSAHRRVPFTRRANPSDERARRGLGGFRYGAGFPRRAPLSRSLLPLPVGQRRPARYRYRRRVLLTPPFRGTTGRRAPTSPR